ncbi:DDE superfamily endonuclease domain, partial [Cinara cedri]
RETARDSEREREGARNNPSGAELNRRFAVVRARRGRKSVFVPVARLPCVVRAKVVFLITDWLKEWDKQLAKEKRHILLAVDNCPAHPPVQTEFIKLVFLPPNTTSVLQPLDQGIIKALKVKFRKKLVLKIINQEEQGKDIKISVLDAILMISDAWNDISTTTIRNCFHHAGFKASEVSLDRERRGEMSDAAVGL